MPTLCTILMWASILVVTLYILGIIALAVIAHKRNIPLATFIQQAHMEADEERAMRKNPMMCIMSYQRNTRRHT